MPRYFADMEAERDRALVEYDNLPDHARHNDYLQLMALCATLHDTVDFEEGDPSEADTSLEEVVYLITKANVLANHIVKLTEKMIRHTMSPEIKANAMTAAISIFERKGLAERESEE